MKCAGCDRQLEVDEPVIEVARVHVYCTRLCCKPALHTQVGLQVTDGPLVKVMVPFSAYTQPLAVGL